MAVVDINLNGHLLCWFQKHYAILNKKKIYRFNLAVSPLQSTAKQLLPILQHSFAYIHGGKDLNNSPIICLPHFSDFRQITEENFRDVLMYLTNVAR